MATAKSTGSPGLDAVNRRQTNETKWWFETLGRGITTRVDGNEACS